MLGNLVLAAGFGMMGLMGNPPRRRRKHSRRRNPERGFGQKIVFDNGQVRILHTISRNGSAYYLVDRDTSGSYTTTTAVAVSKHASLMAATPGIPKDSPPWKRAVKAWLEFLRQKTNPRRKAKHRRRHNPSAGASELALYIVNDGDLYRQNITYVIKNLAKKIKKGTYDAKLALKLWKHSADWGAQKYTKEHGGSGNGTYGAFSANDRRDAAAELQEHYEEELREAAGIKANPRGGRDLTTEVFQIGQNTVVTTQWRNSSGTAFISVQTGGPVGVKVWEAKSQGPSAGGYHKPTQALERVYHKITGEYPRNFGGAGRRELQEVAEAAIKARQNPRRRR